MIEATCSACGALNRVSEANVPAGATFITCSDCKARIAISPPPATTPAAKLPPPIPPAARRSSGPELTDLPAPKRPSSPGPLGSAPTPSRPVSAPTKPTLRGGLAAALDPELPAPKMTRSGHAPPAIDFDDSLTTAPGPGGVVDLPAPKRPAPRAPTGDATRDEIVDLPAPKLDRSEADLLAPKPTARRTISDLPAPRDSAKDATSRPTGIDPPATAAFPGPAGPQGPTIADLPSPRPHDAVARTASADVPASQGLFDDTSPPGSRGEADLPAPKGFFEDLPTVKSNPTKGGVTDIAPKGFFEDLPTVKSNPTKGGVTDIAPKGYFDDIPGLPSTSRPEAPAPKGFFDDIPGLPSTSRPEVPAPKGFFDNLPQPGRAAPEPAAAAAADFQLAPGPELDLNPPPATAGPAAAGPPHVSSSFDDLDRSRPTAPPVRLDVPARPPSGRLTSAEARATEPGLVLELEAPRPDPTAPPEARRPSKTEQAAAPPVADRRPRSRLLLAGLFLAAVVLGGGAALYRHRVVAAERRAAIADLLVQARAAYAATDTKHWQRAAAAARQVLEIDEANPEALGIGSETLLASALDNGTGAAAKIAQAHAMLDTANHHGISTPVLDRARALAALAAHQPDTALAQLQPLASKAPQDGALALYLGWAHAARGDAVSAIQAYTGAMTAPAAKLSALYGRGNAKLDLADLDGARADFTAVLELARDHIGAQVGLAAAQPPAAAQRRETDLLAILARKDLATADPRAVTRAWTLAGDAAMRAGRYDVARERLHKALAVSEQDLAATAALAETELRDGKIAAAAKLTSQALTVSKDNVAAQLVQSEIEIKRRSPLAGQRLDALEARRPPLAPLELARLLVVRGKLADAQGDGQGAADDYVKAAQIARDLDLEPMVSAVSKLTALTRAALAEHDAPRADALRARVDALLGNFADQAARDPLLALTLGVSYLQAGDAEKAEPWLRRAVEARPQDAEARFQLGRALLLSDQPQDALAALRAASDLDQSRRDIAAELARAYEALQRDTDAGALYTKLLAGPDPSLELRARAGRFFARTGAIDKAAEQGAKLLAADPRDPTGLYLKGEALLAAGKLPDARQQLQRAVDADRDPQYLDALGRAAEAIGQSGDREAQELALRIYAEAAEAAPGMLNPLVGQGRLYLLRHEAIKAVPQLSAAVRLAPDSAEVLFLLGAAYQDSQRPAEAREWLGKAVKIAASAEAYWRIAQLERDANHGPAALIALGSAVRLAGATETRTGKPVAWLTDALYLQGRINLDLHNEAAAREAWLVYVTRNPPASAQLTEVKQQLATTLRQ